MAKLVHLESSLIRSINYDLEAFKNDYSVSAKEPKSLPALRFHRNELEQIWEKINGKYDVILESALLDDPEEEKTIDLKKIQLRFLEAKAFYRRAMIYFVECIEALECKQKNTPPDPSPATSTPSCFSIPPCDIEVFNGDYSTWPSFRDLFKAIYGSNARLSGVEKLYYLKQKTQGEAREVVDTAPLTNEGFTLAWTNLTSQYENIRMQVNAQLKTLFNLPSVDVSSGAAVRKLQRTVNGCVNTLKTLNIKTEHWDPILIYLSSSKLPVEILTKFEDTLSDPSVLPAWIEMNSFLTSTYKGLDSVADVKYTYLDHYSQNTNLSYRKRVNISRPQATPSQPAISHTTLTSHASICKFCQGSHILRNCPSFSELSVNDRRKFITDSGCCYNCLAISHTLKDCKSNFSCRDCGSRHHTLLHTPLTHTPGTDQPSSSGAGAVQTFTTLTQTQPQLDREIILGTAVMNVDIHGSLFPARALIDPASDFSFISDNLVQRLHLPTTPISVEVSGLNEVVSARSNRLCQVVLRSNTRQDFSIKIQAIVVETLTQSLPTRKIPRSLPHELMSIELADPKFNESRPIDFIIGSDLYPTIMRIGVKRNVANSLLAQDTEFGWILTGPVEKHSTFMKTTHSHSHNATLPKHIDRLSPQHQN